MADNCPYWAHGRCAPPKAQGYACSWPTHNYENCAVYKMAVVERAGGSMEDQLRAADAIPPGASVAGGRGRILSDREIEQVVSKKTATDAPPALIFIICLIFVAIGVFICTPGFWRWFWIAIGVISGVGTLGMLIEGMNSQKSDEKQLELPGGVTMDDEEYYVRKAAAKALVQIGDPRAVQGGRWAEKWSGQGHYYTQYGRSLLHATEILKAVPSIPPMTYYVVETPDGVLGRDTLGFYTEAPLKTSGLKLEASAPVPDPVESDSLTAFGDAMKSQTVVAQLKSSGQYAAFILLLECGHCSYKSPVETTAGEFERQCYACGATNKSSRATISIYLGSKKVQI
jgi:hypothetical protein